MIYLMAIGMYANPFLLLAVWVKRLKSLAATAFGFGSVGFL
jgi:hypothetical protein